MHTSRTEHLCAAPVFAKRCTEMHASRAALFSAVHVFSRKCFENHASRAALFFGASVFTQKCSEIVTSPAARVSHRNVLKCMLHAHQASVSRLRRCLSNIGHDGISFLTL